MFALRLQNIWSRLLYLCIRKRSWVILKDETAVVQLSPVFRTRSICNTIGVGKLWWSILMANAQINLFVVFLKYHWETNLSSYLSFYSVKKKSVLFKPREKTNTNVDSKTNPKTFILTYRHQSDDPTKEDKPTKKKSHLDNDRKILYTRNLSQKKAYKGELGFKCGVSRCAVLPLRSQDSMLGHDKESFYISLPQTMLEIITCLKNTGIQVKDFKRRERLQAILLTPTYTLCSSFWQLQFTPNYMRKIEMTKKRFWHALVDDRN